MSNWWNKTTKISFARSGEYAYTSAKFSTKIVKLSNFYSVTSNWKKYLIACIVGMFIGVGTLFFVEVTGLYAGGTAAFFQGIARLINVAIQKKFGEQDWIDIVYNSLFWGMYFTMNLIIFTLLYKKLNRQCIIISFIYLVSTQLTGFLLSMIPNIDNITIFGNTSTVNENLKKFGVQCIIYNPNIWPTTTYDVAWGRYNWDILITDPNSPNLPEPTVYYVFSANIVKSFLLIVYAFAYSLISSVGNAILYIIGGSSAGSEMVALYLSEEKNKDVTYSLKISQSVNLFLGALLGSYASGIIVNSQYYSGWQYVINANMIGSFIWVLVNSYFLSKLFPSQKVVKIETFTQYSNEIIKKLKEYNYSNPTTVINSTGGYSGMKNNIITTIVPLLEVSSFVKVVRLIDQKCLITVIAVDDCDGNVTLQKHKSVEKIIKKHERKNKQ